MCHERSRSKRLRRTAKQASPGPRTGWRWRASLPPRLNRLVPRLLAATPSIPNCELVHTHLPSSRLGKRVPWKQAAATVGGILLRYPPGPGMMGHIVVCDGEGGTVEGWGRLTGFAAAKCRAGIGIQEFAAEFHVWVAGRGTRAGGANPPLRDWAAQCEGIRRSGHPASFKRAWIQPGPDQRRIQRLHGGSSSGLSGHQRTCR